MYLLAVPRWSPPRFKDGRLISPRDASKPSFGGWNSDLSLPPPSYCKDTAKFVMAINSMWHAHEIANGGRAAWTSPSDSRRDMKDSLQIIFYRALRGRRQLIPYGRREVLERTAAAGTPPVDQATKAAVDALQCDILFFCARHSRRRSGGYTHTHKESVL